MPALALGTDFEPVDTVPLGEDFEPDNSLGHDFETEPIAAASTVSQGDLPHRLLNDVREFGAGAGRYIFQGIEGLSVDQAKALMKPPVEVTEPQAEEALLPPNEQQKIRERRTLQAREQIQPALDSAGYWWKRAAEVDKESKVDPALAQTWDARLSRAGGEAAIMGMEGFIPGVGIPIMALNGAAAAETEARNAGKTNEQSEQAAVRALIGLGIFGGVSKVAALGVAKLLPEGTKTLTRFVTQFAGQDAANEASSRAIAAWDAASDAKPGEKIAAATKALTNTNLETSTLNAVYAGIGAAHETGEVRPIGPNEKIDFEPDPQAEGKTGPTSIESRLPVEDVEIPDARNSEPKPAEVQLNPGEIPIEQLTKEITPAVPLPFQMDPDIPASLKIRWDDTARAHGLNEEQTASLSTADAAALDAATWRKANEQELAQRARQEAAIETQPRIETQLTSEEVAERDYRKQLMDEANEAQGAEGRELLEAVIDSGGLPSRESPHRKTFEGEFATIEEEARNPMREEKISLNKLFRRDAPSADELATRLREQGFVVERPDDVLDMVRDRIRTGRMTYGTPSAHGVTFASGAATPRGSRATMANEYQGEYGTGTSLREPATSHNQGAAPAAGKAELSRIHARFVARNDAIARSRDQLASEIEKAGGQISAQRDISTIQARDYARRLIADYADAARGGVVPQRLRIPIYDAEYNRRVETMGSESGDRPYRAAAQFAFDAVHGAMSKLRFTAEQHIYFSGRHAPARDAGPFIRGSHEGIQWAANEVRKMRSNRTGTSKATVASGASASNPASAAHRGPSGSTGSPAPPSSPAISAAIAPLQSWWRQHTLGIRKQLGPQTIDAPARMVANIIRDYNGQLANRIVQADHALEEARKDFDRTPVPKNWKYDPSKPLPRNYAFVAESERGGANLSQADRALKAQLDKMFEEAVDEVQRIRPQALQSLIQNYFPHIWKDPAAAQRAFVSILGHRPLEGSKSFLKKRSMAYIEDGLKAGLRPISDNPIDLALTKLHEVHKFVAAQDMLAEAKAIGARKFVYIFEQPPDGWMKVDDPTSTVHGPPFVSVPEAFDEQMRVKTVELLNSLGVPHERIAKLGGKRWGTYQTGGGGIRTKFAGPLSIYWHEMGHALEERYGWLDTILRGNRPGGQSHVAIELRKLADLRGEGQQPNKSFQNYIRNKDEKAAVMLEAYIHAPNRMRDVAPVIYGRVRKFISLHPELRAIEDIRPSLVIGSSKQQIPVGGMVTLGNYYMPEGAAQVFNNYLSKGLMRYQAIRSIREATNIMSGLQLGFSAFHAGFTSIDAAVSQFALGLRYASEGKLVRAAQKIVTTPVAPFTNYYTGKAVQRAMIDPAWGGELKIGFPKVGLGKEIQLSRGTQDSINRIAQLAVQGGLRATVDPFWKTQITRNVVRAWNEGGVRRYTGTALRLPFAFSEQMMRPILEYLVPRQKLGVFAGMAQQHMERLGPNADIHQVRDAMARAADATEDRMGQMTYDNLFYNRILRDVALLGFRAYGWTYGKYRALFGGVTDLIQTPGRIRSGGPVVSDRMAYFVALPMVAAGIGSIMNYLMTGEPPRDWKDALMPRTGKLDRNGNPQRLSLPTYIKDILSDWHDFPNTKKMLVSFGHKLNPWFSIASDILTNADYFGTKIYNADDPIVKKQFDKILFTARSATPFSVTSAMRLSESHPTFAEQVLPFFGFVPAKAELSMTPAQVRAAELMRESLPRGARTAEQAERSQLIARLMRDMKEHDPNWQSNLNDALTSGKLKLSDLSRIFSSLPLSPLQYQVKKLSAENALKVWDLANEAERKEIRYLLMQKIGASKQLSPEERIRLFQVIRQ